MNVDELIDAHLGPEVAHVAYQENPSVRELIRWWCNEKAAPELLPYQEALVEGFYEREAGGAQPQQLPLASFAGVREEDLPLGVMRVDGLLKFIEAQQGAVHERRRDVYIKGLYQLDIDRIKFVLASYLRTRLGKIQRWQKYLIAQPPSKLETLLSRAERQFLEDYDRARTQLFNSAVLDQLPNTEPEGGGCRRGWRWIQ